MKFTHKDDKTKVFETDNKNVFSMLKREGYEPSVKGGWKALEEAEEEKITEE